MKRFLCLLLMLTVLPVRVDALSVGASSAILMDAESGRVLYEQNIHQPRLIASITKLMTALVAAERCADPDEKITVLPQWVGAEGSSIYLKAGETVTFRELLYGMLLQSGNDAAVAVACRIAGSEQAFAELMNEKALELGMKNSSFANASGLNQEGHYSTAYDMALLARACLKNEAVAEACATRSVTIGTRTFVNHNKLLFRCEGCVGMKTGYTERAGRTLVSAVTRDGQTLVCVTLNDPDDWNDHEKLYDFGFSQFPRKVLCEEGHRFGSVPVSGSLVPTVAVRAAVSVGYPLKEGEQARLNLELIPFIEAPVSEGTVAGWAVWTLNGSVIGETELICVNGVNRDVCPRKSMVGRLIDWFDE